MIRRSLVFLFGYNTEGFDQNPMMEYSLFGNHYADKQGMRSPVTINRNMEMPYSGGYVNKRRTTYVPVEIHPVFRIALEPYISKLCLSRVVPPTPVDEAVADYKRIAPLIGDRTSRHGYLAKVIELCTVKRNYDAGMKLWQEEGCDEAYVTGNDVPPFSLAIAGICNASVAATDGDQWLAMYNATLQDKWNITPQFSPQVWSHVLFAAGKSKGDMAVVDVLKEAVDVLADIDTVPTHYIVYALNAVKDKAAYEAVKPVLFKFSQKKIERMFKLYRNWRAHPGPEYSKRCSLPDDFELPENDAMFYHVGWHLSLRSPRAFDPRQLHFDYDPASTSAVIENKPNLTGEGMMKAKLEKWKKEGLLPEDYDVENSFKVLEEKQAVKKRIKEKNYMGDTKRVDKRHGGPPVEI